MESCLLNCTTSRQPLLVCHRHACAGDVYFKYPGSWIDIKSRLFRWYPPQVWRGEADGLGQDAFALLFSFKVLFWELWPLSLRLWRFVFGSACEFLSMSLLLWSCSNTTTTSFMVGRNLGSGDRHLRARLATLRAPTREYWPSIRVSKTRKIFLLLDM